MSERIRPDTTLTDEPELDEAERYLAQGVRTTNGLYTPGFDWAKYARHEYSEPERIEIMTRFVEARLQGLSISKSAANAGVTRKSIRDWCKQNPIFAQAARDAKAFIVDGAEDTLVSIMNDTEAARRDRIMAAFGVLNAHHPAYRRAAGKPDLSNQTKPNVTIQIHFGPPPPRQLPPQSGEEIIVDDD